MVNDVRIFLVSIITAIKKRRSGIVSKESDKHQLRKPRWFIGKNGGLQGKNWNFKKSQRESVEARRRY